MCNASSCNNGCCNGAACVPYASQTPSVCGAGGGMCGGCPAGTTCNGAGQCVCNASSCPTGCCDGNSCIAYGNQSDTKCGASGATCAACSSGLRCAKSNAGCATWCGLRSAPAGVAAGDYACLDFDTGFPPASTWPAAVEAPSTLELITATAASSPNALEPYCAIGLGGGDALLTWTAASSSSTVKSYSLSAAINPRPMMAGWTTADMHFLCAVLPGTFESRACLSYIYQEGLSLSYKLWFGDSVIMGSCPVSGTAPADTWTNVELRFNVATGQLQAVVGGTISSCQPDNKPTPVTAAKVKVGLFTENTSDVGFTMRIDNVVVALTR